MSRPLAMIFKRLHFSIWIIVGLLSFFVLGGLGTIPTASSSAPGTPTSNSTMSVPGLPSAEPTQTPNPEMKTYVVEPGDTLWSIAVKFYGNGAKYTLIQRANDLPDSALLHMGQVLSIPVSETEKTPSPATPSPVPSQLFLAPTVSPTAVIFSQPAATTAPTPAPNVAATIAPTPVPDLAATTTDTGLVPVVPIVVVVINVLGVVCLLGSIVCAMLSYDIYRRSRHYARRRYIGNRVRAGL